MALEVAVEDIEVIGMRDGISVIQEDIRQSIDSKKELLGFDPYVQTRFVKK